MKRILLQARRCPYIWPGRRTTRVSRRVLGRALVVRRLEMLPVECVARGYLTARYWITRREGMRYRAAAGPVEASWFATAVHPGD